MSLASRLTSRGRIHTGVNWDMKLRGSSTVALVLLLLPVLQLRAQEGPRLDEPVQAHPEGDAAIDKLKSPFCPGLMLEVCAHPQSKLLRDTLQVMAHEGASSDSLVSWMLANYGEEYRAVPLTSGSGLFAWLMPPLALLGGLLAVVVALKHFRARREVGEPVSAPISEEDESRLAQALQELKAAEEIPF